MCVCVCVFATPIFLHFCARFFRELHSAGVQVYAHLCVCVCVWVNFAFLFFVFISFRLFSFHQLDCFQWKKKCTCMTFNASITMIETFAVAASFHFLFCFAWLFRISFLSFISQFACSVCCTITKPPPPNYFVVFEASVHLFEVFDHFSSVLTDAQSERERHLVSLNEEMRQTLWLELSLGQFLGENNIWIYGSSQRLFVLNEMHSNW